MVFQMRVQPLDGEVYEGSEPIRPRVSRSRLKRLFDRKVEKNLPLAESVFEPSSVCLNNMVQNFIEQVPEVKCVKSRCNCFKGYSNDSSDDEFNALFEVNSVPDSLELVKTLIPCASVYERNLLADTSEIVERNKGYKRKDDLRAIVIQELSILNYDASICKSRWERTLSYPAGEYEYIDVVMDGGERILIDVDFRSEFEVARSTAGYKMILQSLPLIFVGKPDRLLQIIVIISEAATQSLKKKGLSIAPWRKAEYMNAKWLSPYSRSNGRKQQFDPVMVLPEPQHKAMTENECCVPELIIDQKALLPEGNNVKDFPAKVWELPVVKPKRSERVGRAGTGLASLLKEKL